MMDDLKPYPEYKESGIPWIGSVPHDWRVERGRKDSMLDGKIQTCCRSALSDSHENYNRKTWTRCQVR
jgi:hypothetical protein